ncbi:MMPL family transporter [Streptomyces sp. NPDC014622]|uniref:MMPL family transporter n=1 Tax=Streptomyces sp. NPDC014622 TaxID=3364874 RepID=UPI0037002B0C
MPDARRSVRPVAGRGRHGQGTPPRTRGCVHAVSVVAGFVFNAQPVIKQVGFALALGILIDAFVIRMTFIPATMAIVEEKAWWIPGRLDRLLPDLVFCPALHRDPRTGTDRGGPLVCRPGPADVPHAL